MTLLLALFTIKAVLAIMLNLEPIDCIVFLRLLVGIFNLTVGIIEAGSAGDLLSSSVFI